MKNRIFFRKDEVVLSTITAFIVVGLMYQGFYSLWNQQDHTMFKSSRSSYTKKVC